MTRKPTTLQGPRPERLLLTCAPIISLETLERLADTLAGLLVTDAEGHLQQVIAVHIDAPARKLYGQLQAMTEAAPFVFAPVPGHATEQPPETDAGDARQARRGQFTDSTGTPLADVSMPTMNIVGLVLSYDGMAGWQVNAVTAFLGNVQGTVCQAGIAALWLKAGGGNPAVPLHDQGVEGCELGLPINGVNAGRYVWRFGVLLAADAQAQTIMSTLPIASPAEIAAVGGRA